VEPIPRIPSLFPPHEYKAPLSRSAIDEFFPVAIWFTLTYGKLSTNWGSTVNWMFFPIPSCPTLLDPNVYKKLRWFLSTTNNVCALPHDTCYTSPIMCGRDNVRGTLIAWLFLGSTPSWPIWLRPHTIRRVSSPSSSSYLSNPVYTLGFWCCCCCNDIRSNDYLLYLSCCTSSSSVKKSVVLLTGFSMAVSYLE
jgi:hypothetical protein